MYGASEYSLAKERKATHLACVLRIEGMNEHIKKALAIERQNKEKILKLKPFITEESGIYVFSRKDENGIKYAYVGQAKHLLTRVAQHLSGYQHIDLSIKKRGFKSIGNPTGWDFTIIFIEESKLDEYEQAFIKSYAGNGFQLLNKTAGGQGEGKVQIAEYKPSKTYRDGLRQGKIALSRDLKHIMDKHLTIELKPSKKGNKTSEKALEKFMSLLEEDTYKE